MEAHLVVVKAMVTKFLFFNIMPFLFERSTWIVVYTKGILTSLAIQVICTINLDDS
jgi:hypothetical protein